MVSSGNPEVAGVFQGNFSRLGKGQPVWKGNMIKTLVSIWEENLFSQIQSYLGLHFLSFFCFVSRWRNWKRPFLSCYPHGMIACISRCRSNLLETAISPKMRCFYIFLSRCFICVLFWRPNFAFSVFGFGMKLQLMDFKKLLEDEVVKIKRDSPSVP